VAFVSFDGTTFANDTSGSAYYLAGDVQARRLLAQENVNRRVVPRGTGTILIPTGTQPGSVILSFQLLMTASDEDTFATAVEAKKNRVGQLQYPPDKTRNFMKMVYADLIDTGFVRGTEGNKYRYQVVFVFEALEG
jgi:hypothetical protein